MSLKYGLLGYLSHHPMTGYELHKFYPKAARPTIAYIYRSLISMEKEGLVEHTRVDQVKRPDRKVFSITDAGLQELDRWLATPLHYVIPRNHLLVQVINGSRVGKATLINNITSQKAEIENLLAIVSNKRNWTPLPGGDSQRRSAEKKYLQVTYASAVDLLQRQLEWLDAIIERISQIKE